MCWTLCRSACACGWRPLRSTLRANPFVAAICVVAAVATPLLALAAGRAAAPAIDAASRDPALARAFALALVAGCVSVGAAFGSLAPTRALLGAALEAAPVRRSVAFLGLTLLPATAVALPLLLVLTAFVVPATSQSGVWAPVAVVAGTCAAVAIGVAGSEAAVVAVRRPGAGSIVAGVLAATWTGSGAFGGSVLLGPAAPLSDAVSGATLLDVAALGGTGVVAVAAWALACVLRPEARPSSGLVRISFRLPRGALRATAAASFVRLARNAHVRRHVLTGCGLSFGGAVALRVTVDAAAPFLAGLVALVLASAIPLVAAGLRRDCAWLVRAAPLSRAHSALVDAGASMLAGYAVALLVLVSAAPLAPFGAGELLVLEATLALVLGAAAATGAVLPWRHDRVLDQVASYAVLAAVTVALSFVLGRAVEAAPAVGLADTQLAAIVAHAALVAGVVVAGALD